MVLAANSFYLAIDPNMMFVNTIISIYYYTHVREMIQYQCLNMITNTSFKHVDWTNLKSSMKK